MRFSSPIVRLGVDRNQVDHELAKRYYDRLPNTAAISEFFVQLGIATRVVRPVISLDRIAFALSALDIYSGSQCGLLFQSNSFQ